MNVGAGIALPVCRGELMLEEVLKKIDLSRLSKREKVILAITSTVIIYVIFYQMVYSSISLRERHLMDELNLTESEISSLEKQLRDLKAEIGRLKLLEEKGTKEQVSAQVEELFPKGKVLSGFLDDITKADRWEKVEFLTVQPEAVEDRDLYLELSVRMNLRSRYQDLWNYLRVLESMPRIINVRDIRIETNPEINPYILSTLLVVTYMGKE